MTNIPEWVGVLEHIFVCEIAGEEMHELATAVLVEGRGTEGDRYFLGTGHYSSRPHADRQITLIEQETLDTLERGMAADDAMAGDPFDVSLSVSQRDLHVPANKSLLQALRDENLPIEYSCEGGICGTCWVEYSDGDPIHRDSFLTSAQRDTKILSCVSRARTHLTLVI